jgi:hypothetical protein
MWTPVLAQRFPWPAARRDNRPGIFVRFMTAAPCGQNIRRAADAKSAACSLCQASRMR